MHTKASILAAICLLYGGMRAAITTSPNGGRFGDQILCYWHAKWVSYKTGLPLLYKPFICSEQLSLHVIERHYTEGIKRQFKHIYEIPQRGELPLNFRNDTLYAIPYFPECLQEYEHGNPSGFIYFAVDWDDPYFIAEIKRCTLPLKPLPLIEIPKGRIAVGVHVRKNSNNFDLPMLHEVALQGILMPPGQRYCDVVFPLKHVPEVFYWEGVKRIYEMCDHRPLYVFIFTDDHHPEILVQRFKQYLGNPDNVEFAYREVSNGHDVNILEDFFSMMQFDCFVRADSNISIAATKLGTYKIQITPSAYRWDGPHLRITKIALKMRANNELPMNRRGLFDGISDQASREEPVCLGYAL